MNSAPDTFFGWLACEMEGEEDLPSALIVVLDLNESLWGERARSGWPSVQDVLESLLAFIRAFFLCKIPCSNILTAGECWCWTSPRGC